MNTGPSVTGSHEVVGAEVAVVIGGVLAAETLVVIVAIVVSVDVVAEVVVVVVVHLSLGGSKAQESAEVVSTSATTTTPDHVTFTEVSNDTITNIIDHITTNSRRVHDHVHDHREIEKQEIDDTRIKSRSSSGTTKRSLVFAKRHYYMVRTQITSKSFNDRNR